MTTPPGAILAGECFHNAFGGVIAKIALIYTLGPTRL
jgi:hypothetical protein